MVIGRVFEVRIPTTDAELQHIGTRLSALRKLSGLTQRELADRLGIGQPALARLEKRPDILVSTLRDYLTALGAKLRIDATVDPSAIVSGLAESDYGYQFTDEDQFVLPIIGEGPLPEHRDVVFSIKPEYSEKILSGEKTVELRRRFPTDIPNGTCALIYATTPTRALTGIALIGDVARMSPKEIWKVYSSRACIKRRDFDAYFDGVQNGVVIELRHARSLRRAVPLDELRDRFNFEPPQSFLYAKGEFRKALEGDRVQVSHRH